MKRYRSTILICGGTGCVAAGSLKINDQFLTEIRKHKLQDEVNVVLTGCNGIRSSSYIPAVFSTADWKKKPSPASRKNICSRVASRRNFCTSGRQWRARCRSSAKSTSSATSTR
jgi:hypothetical protein